MELSGKGMLFALLAKKSMCCMYKTQGCNTIIKVISSELQMSRIWRRYVKWKL